MSREYADVLETVEAQIDNAVKLLVAVTDLDDGRRIALGMIETALAIEHHRRYGKLKAQH